MLVELGLVEQRLMAVREVFDGATVTDVATRNGVTRQTVHNWLRSYANSGVAGLVDKSSKPETCPHQMTPVVEARIVEMRRSHPRWGLAVAILKSALVATKVLTPRGEMFNRCSA
jgi:transposase-like protein